MLRVQGFPRKSSRFAVASWHGFHQCQSTLIQSLYVSPGHLSLVYQQNLRGSIQQIAFRMASLNLITFAHMNEAFFFENPHEKNAFFISLRISMQPKKAFCVVLETAVLLKKTRQASILTPLALSKNWQLFGTISHTSKYLQVCRPSSETKLDSFSRMAWPNFAAFCIMFFIHVICSIILTDTYSIWYQIYCIIFLPHVFYSCSYLVLSLYSLEANHIDHHSKWIINDRWIQLENSILLDASEIRRIFTCQKKMKSYKNMVIFSISTYKTCLDIFNINWWSPNFEKKSTVWILNP